jgi:hypothetical protein
VRTLIARHERCAWPQHRRTRRRSRPCPGLPRHGYRPAKPLDDYVRRFPERLSAEHNGEIAFSCNCIFNYLHSKLGGKRTGAFLGPITFGEVAYQLVNQTLAYLIVMDR